MNQKSIGLILSAISLIFHDSFFDRIEDLSQLFTQPIWTNETKPFSKLLTDIKYILKCIFIIRAYLDEFSLQTGKTCDISTPGHAVDKDPPACNRHGFHAWSRKIPHAVDQRSLCTTFTEPECCNCWSSMCLGLAHPEKPPQWEAPTVRWRAGPARLQRACAKQWRHSMPETVDNTSPALTASRSHLVIESPSWIRQQHSLLLPLLQFIPMESYRYFFSYLIFLLTLLYFFFVRITLLCIPVGHLFSMLYKIPWRNMSQFIYTLTDIWIISSLICISHYYE